MLNLKSIYRITHDPSEKKQYVELKFNVVFFNFIVLVLRILYKIWCDAPKSHTSPEKYRRKRFFGSANPL